MSTASWLGSRAMCGFWIGCATVASVAFGTTAVPRAQIVSSQGQNVVPVYEGWRKNADGSSTMFFGYFNRNWDEQVNIQIGSDNSFEPPDADRGQPTHFYPKRREFVFSVVVPKDWGQKDLVWTLTSHGKTEKAYGSLRDIYEVDNELIAKNMGAGSFGLMLANKDLPPSVAIEPVESQSVVANVPVRLTATVSDDGVPPPPANRTAQTSSSGRGVGNSGLFLNTPQKAEPRRPRGLSVEWIQYRGPGMMKFEPAGYQAVANGGKASTSATFSQPGTYVVRAIASDSLLYGVKDVTIVISAR